MKRVLITGITGFAGSHLADFLLSRHPEVEVWGTCRWRCRRENIEHLEGRIQLVECELGDPTSLARTLAQSRPDAIFHLAAQSFVPTSWVAPAETFDPVFMRCLYDVGQELFRSGELWRQLPPSYVVGMP